MVVVVAAMRCDAIVCQSLKTLVFFIESVWVNKSARACSIPKPAIKFTSLFYCGRQPTVCRAAKTHWHTNIHIQLNWNRFCHPYWMRECMRCDWNVCGEGQQHYKWNVANKKQSLWKIEHKLRPQRKRCSSPISHAKRVQWTKYWLCLSPSLSLSLALHGSPCHLVPKNTQNENETMKWLIRDTCKLKKNNNGEILWRDWWLTCDRSHGLREKLDDKCRKSDYGCAWNALTRLLLLPVLQFVYASFVTQNSLLTFHGP